MRVACRAALLCALLLAPGAATAADRIERVPPALPPPPPEVYLDRSGVGELFVWEAIIGAAGGGYIAAAALGSDPSGAEVYVDGRWEGQSPAVIARRAGLPSRMRVQLRREGYRDEELLIDAAMSPAAAALGVFYGFSWFWAWDYDEDYVFCLRPIEAPAPKEGE